MVVVGALLAGRKSPDEPVWSPNHVSRSVIGIDISHVKHELFWIEGNVACFVLSNNMIYIYIYIFIDFEMF